MPCCREVAVSVLTPRGACGRSSELLPADRTEEAGRARRAAERINTMVTIDEENEVWNKSLFGARHRDYMGFRTAADRSRSAVLVMLRRASNPRESGFAWVCLPSSSEKRQ